MLLDCFCNKLSIEFLLDHVKKITTNGQKVTLQR
jgi:hypothetical protein